MTKEILSINSMSRKEYLWLVNYSDVYNKPKTFKKLEGKENLKKVGATPKEGKFR